MAQDRVSRFAVLPNHRLAVGLISKGSSRIWASGGFAEEKNAKDVYEIGSLTKTMTGLLLAIGEQKGHWSRTDTLSDLIPEWSSSPFAAQTTLLQLVTHTANLPRIPGNFCNTVTDKLNPYANYSERHLVEALLSESLKPNPKHLYSNYGFGLLGWLLAKRLGLSLGDALRQWIFDPLSMNRTELRTSHAQHHPAELVPVGGSASVTAGCFIRRRMVQRPTGITEAHTARRASCHSIANKGMDLLFYPTMGPISEASFP